MLLYNIDLAKVDSGVTPILLNQMVDLFSTADQIVVCIEPRESVLLV